MKDTPTSLLVASIIGRRFSYYMRFSIKIATVPLVLAGVLTPYTVAEDQEADMTFDSFGGNMAIQGEATGFFHLEEIDGRHFLVTPEGNGYRALGLNHFHNLTSKDYDGAIQNINPNLSHKVT